MARYRNEDNVCMMFDRFFNMCQTKEQKTLVLDMKQAFLEIKTADVVPRSEVCGFTAEELAQKCESLSIELEAMRTSANSYKMHYENAKQEVEKIFEEIERSTINSNFEFMFVNKKYFAELKKKYTKESEGERYKYAERNRCNE